MAYNNSMHRSTGFIPFKVATGEDFMSMPASGYLAYYISEELGYSVTEYLASG